MDECKISIIVPIYNVKNTLNRCVESLLKQDIDGYEILLVDDGSPDESGRMCDDFIRDGRVVVRVFHKKNEGLGLTRNYGLERAIGKYVIFVDSDDYIQTNILGLLYEHVEKNDSDLCYYKRVKVKKDGNTIHETFPVIIPSSNELAGMCLGEPLKKDTYEVGPAWKAIYRRAYLKDNGFIFLSEREVLSEDYVFSVPVCLGTDKVSFFDREVYYYCDNENSLTKEYQKDRLDRAIGYYKKMMNTIKCENIGYDSEKRCYNNLLISVLVVIQTIYFSAMSKNEKEIETRKICNNVELKSILKSRNDTDTLKLSIIRRLVLMNNSKLIRLMMRIRYGEKTNA